MRAAPDPVTPELLENLVDDAGLFPPERLPMEAALARHRADEAAGHSMLTDRFLCPASRLGELRAALDSAGGVGGLRLGLIADTGLDGVAAVLAETDPDRLTALAREVSPGNAKLARSLLVAYGSCSTSEPREEAVALGLVAEPG